MPIDSNIFKKGYWNYRRATLDVAVADRDVERCKKKTLNAKAKALQKRFRKVQLEIDVQSKKVKRASKKVHKSDRV